MSEGGFDAVVQHFFPNSKICMAKVVLIRKIIEAYFKFTCLFIGLVSSSSACLGQHFPYFTCLCFCNLKRHWQNIFTWTFAVGVSIQFRNGYWYPPITSFLEIIFLEIIFWISCFWKSYFWQAYFSIYRNESTIDMRHDQRCLRA